MARLSGYYIMDCIDLYDTYNCVIGKGSYASILQYPKRKEPRKNDWFESDGVEVDLSEAFYEPTEINLKFFLFHKDKFQLISNIKSLETLFTSAGNRTFNLQGISKPSIILRYDSSSNSSTNITKELNNYTFETTAKFYCDNPQDLIKTLNTSFIPFTPIHNSKVLIDNINVSDCGIYVSSFIPSIINPYSLKSILARTFARKSGTLAYNSTKPKNKSKELSIEFVLVSNSIANIIDNYCLLFSKLNKDGGLKITHNLLSKQYMCYYDSQSNLELLGFGKSSNRYAIKFTISMVCYYELGYNTFDDTYDVSFD